MPLPAPLGSPTAETFELFPWCDGSELARDLPTAVRDSLLDAREHDGVNHPEEGTARFSRELPGGYAGVWLVDGAPVFAMVDPSHAEVVRAALNDRLGGSGLSLSPESPVVQVRWSFAQLWEWNAYLESVIVAPEAFVSVDLDELRNRIVVGLTSHAAREELAPRLYARDVPCQLILLELTEGVEEV
jgi:hypothetical protein